MACYNGHLGVVELLLKVKGCRYRECGPAAQKPADVARIRGHAAIRKVIRGQERWYYQRVIWIGHEKEKDCLFSRLPTSVVKLIVGYFITTDGRLNS